ncbi:hypothetical protein [Vibrio alfacsensis]|uniref:hypothetical protein n=1 Tax=Vibrio alfacsensis TaxID=1074311 RepID=UPI004067F328
MGISSEHFVIVAFLSELSTQCRLFKRSYEHLKVASEHWVNLSRGIHDGNKATPLDIVAECTICLSVMSAIGRILCSESTPTAKNRSEALRKLLGDPCITNLTSKKVRNSWEHHDERMDKLLKNLSIGDSLSKIHVMAKPPRETCFVLKRFDPVGLSIHFLKDTIELNPCLDEINNLLVKLDVAIESLNTQERA